MEKKRKVLFIDKAHLCLAEGLQKMDYECHDQTKAPKEIVRKNIGEYFGLVVRSRFRLDEAFLSGAGQLAFIARVGIGLEHIDLNYAQKRGIKVFNSPEGSRNAVGEHALGLLLCVMNNLSRADRQVRRGIWEREGNRGVEIMGKTVGIIGYGNTGQAFARRLQGFEAEVIAYDKYRGNYGDAYAKEAGLQEVFDRADIVSIHIPYMPENHYFIDGEFLKSFHKNIFLLNTSRGLVLHTADLVAQLKNGKLRGVALDVIEYEETSFAQLDPDQLPQPFQYLRQAENVVLNPHIAGWSQEAELGHARVLLEKIRKGLG